MLVQLHYYISAAHRTITLASGDGASGLSVPSLPLPLLPPPPRGDANSGRHINGEVGLPLRRRRHCCFAFLLPLSTTAWCCAVSAVSTAYSGPNSKGAGCWPSRMPAWVSKSGNCQPRKIRKRTAARI